MRLEKNTRRNLEAESPRRRAADRIHGAAMALLLACAAGRAFLAEIPFRLSPVQITEASARAARGEISSHGLVDRQEGTRAVFGVLLLAAGALWLLSGAVEGELRVRYPHLALLWGGFAVWSFFAAWRAIDARAAWLSWLDQVSLSAAGFVMIQLCRSRRRFVLLAVVLAATGVALTAKGLMQRAWEQADNTEFFQQYGPQRLVELGMRPDDPQAKSFARRVFSPKLTAYFGLANILAAGLLVLLAATAGLAVAKMIYARHLRRRDGPLPAGHVRPASLAAILTAAMLPPMVAVFFWTGCRGAIGAAGGVLIIFLIAFPFRSVLAKHWKRCAVAAGILLATGVAVGAGYGLTRDRLPGGKTMTIRWFYWTAAAHIVRENPVWGVGPGNFPRAYLRLRRAEAEEAVKDPHNVLAHAACQFGLPGAGLYLALLGGMLLAAWKPLWDEPSPAKQAIDPPSRKRRSAATAILVVSTVFLCRCFLDGAGDDPLLMVLEGVLPTTIFAVALAGMRWFGGPAEDWPENAIRAIRPALAAGATAFALHEFVSYGLWMPGTAGLFWTASAGAAARGSGRRVTLRSGAGRWLATVLAAAGTIAAWLHIVTPAARRLSATRQAVNLLLRNDPAAAFRFAREAAESDPTDGIAAADAARFCLLSPADRTRKNADGSPVALVWAREAIRRNDSAASWRLAVQIARELNLPAEETAALWRGAVERDPAEARLRLEYAAWLAAQNQPALAAEQLDAAETLERKLARFDPESVCLFGPAERDRIQALRKQIAEATRKKK